jgi:hypothetical protein
VDLLEAAGFYIKRRERIEIADVSRTAAGMHVGMAAA